MHLGEKQYLQSFKYNLQENVKRITIEQTKISVNYYSSIVYNIDQEEKIQG